MISKSIIFSKYLVNNIYPTLAKVPFSLRSSQPSRHISRRSKSNIVNHLALDSLQIWKPKWYPDLALMCLIDSANIAAFTNQYGSFNFIQFSFRCGVSLPAFAVSSRYFALSSSTHLRWVSFGRVSTLKVSLLNVEYHRNICVASSKVLLSGHLRRWVPSKNRYETNFTLHKWPTMWPLKYRVYMLLPTSQCQRRRVGDLVYAVLTAVRVPVYTVRA